MSLGLILLVVLVLALSGAGRRDRVRERPQQLLAIPASAGIRGKRLASSRPMLARG